MFSLLLDLGLFVLTVIAIVRSARAKFSIGTLGGLVRLGLLVAEEIMSVWNHPTPARAKAVLGALLFGLLISGSVVLAAFRFKRDVPMAQEDAASGPVKAWLPVAVTDATALVFAVMTLLLASD